jgi:subtilisin family serine protease/subtilisin-like proprotein convertase family protein
MICILQVIDYKRADFRKMTRLPIMTLLLLCWSIIVARDYPLSGGAYSVNDNQDVRYDFLEPQPTSYLIKKSLLYDNVPTIRLLSVNSSPQAIAATINDGSKRQVLFWNRVALQIEAGFDFESYLAGSPLFLARTIAENTYILQAPDTPTAIKAAENLSKAPYVKICYPIRQRQYISPQSQYSPYPNDTYFAQQWHLENRSDDASRIGPDLNVRAAWPLSTGKEIVVAVADDGIDIGHPDLAPACVDTLHFNFVTQSSDGSPLNSTKNHGTPVAGIVAARNNNRLGVAGVAPEASLASWIIWDDGGYLANEEAIMDMFQYRSNIVAVQNHSWGNSIPQQLEVTLLEQIGMSNAVTFGRKGLGSIIVRAAANGRKEMEDQSGVTREAYGNANDDGYLANRFVIAVAAVGRDGRATSYSNPGACLLVAGMSGDGERNMPGIATTDRQGEFGYSTNTSDTSDRADYIISGNIFDGTSCSAPQIAGLAALILAINPELHYRDIQQIILHAAKHFDLGDPHRQVNGAGFHVSHNVGFGIPDAGLATRLAGIWASRPPLSLVTKTITEDIPIPDDGVRVEIGDPSNSAETVSFLAHGGIGALYPDRPMSFLPLVHLGQVTNELSCDLTGSGALIKRGYVKFTSKIEWAADAGAEYVIIYNNILGNSRMLMTEVDYSPIPAFFVTENDGQRLQDIVEDNPDIGARLSLHSASRVFNISNTLNCEHVSAYLKCSHPSRGDLRITLESPNGTISVLQHQNTDSTPGPRHWAYYSTQFFHESSFGKWILKVTDEKPNQSGSILEARLEIYGTAIEDTDHDGIEDKWEKEHFGELSYGAVDDPDCDGFSNMREYIIGLSPLAKNLPFEIDINKWNDHIVRLSWPSVEGYQYDIYSGDTNQDPLSLASKLFGQFPETEWFTAISNRTQRIFRIYEKKQ